MTDIFRALRQELVYLNDVEVDDWTRKWADAVKRTRAALDQPEPQGPTVMGIIELHTWMEDEWRANNDGEDLPVVDFARGVLARWGRPAIEPVPVSERLPGRKDCDAEGCCWAIGKRGDWMCVHTIGRSWSNPIYTHWLPHWALPVPGVEGEP